MSDQSKFSYLNENIFHQGIINLTRIKIGLQNCGFILVKIMFFKLWADHWSSMKLKTPGNYLVTPLYILPVAWNVSADTCSYSRGSWERCCCQANTASGCDTVWFFHGPKRASSFSDRRTIIEITTMCWQFPHNVSYVTGPLRDSITALQTI